MDAHGNLKINFGQRFIPTVAFFVAFVHFVTVPFSPAFADVTPASFLTSSDRPTPASASLTGHSMGSFTTLGLAAGNEFTQTVTRRQNKTHSFSNGVGTSQVFFGEADDVKLQERVDKVMDIVSKEFGIGGGDGGSLPQFWSSDFKRQGRVSSSNGFDTYNYDLNGFSGGVDMHVGTNWNFGLAAGYTRVTSNFEALGRTATAVNAYQASLYTTFEHEQGSIDSNISFNKFENHSERSILGDISNDMADASGKGYQIAWTLSAMGHGKYDKFSITPLTGFTFTNLHRGDMNENGAGMYGLSSSAANSSSLKPMLGIDVARSYSYQSNMTITPEIYGIYRYEMLDANESATTQLSNFSTTAAISHGAKN